jgi:hypothetical protein
MIILRGLRRGAGRRGRRQEDVMSKSHDRPRREKKKPKSDKDRPKHMSAYKAAQSMSAAQGHSASNTFEKKS